VVDVDGLSLSKRAVLLKPGPFDLPTGAWVQEKPGGIGGNNQLHYAGACRRSTSDDLRELIFEFDFYATEYGGQGIHWTLKKKFRTRLTGNRTIEGIVHPAKAETKIDVYMTPGERWYPGEGEGPVRIWRLAGADHGGPILRAVMGATIVKVSP